MGVIVFIVAMIAGIYGLIYFNRSLSNEMPAASSRRRVISIDPGPPVVTPVATAQIPGQLPPKPPARVVPISVQAPLPVARHSNVLATFPLATSPTEESLLLRILVQGVFVISIISTDLAAGTHYSWVGIPVSTAGAAWSWYRRHYAKHRLNLAVSIASLVILIGLLAPILAKEMQMAIERSAVSADATNPQFKISVAISLGLGMLLVALQIGLSFHLYNRRVLGYCLVIGGLLMGVAASLSQNLGFLILLCGWLAIAIPALMLDYRSKLGLQPIGIASVPTRHQLSYQHLPWTYLSQLVAISLGLGLMLAVFLPSFHLPKLSFQPPGLNSIQTLAEKYDPPQPGSPARSPEPIGTPTPEPTVRELATAALGQPENNHYPDIIKQDNLELPPELAREVRQFTQKILATSPQPLKSDFERATYIAEYLKKNHQADPQEQLAANQQVAADAKLFQKYIAKCAAAPTTCQLAGSKRNLPILFTSMLRSISIPARLKTGDKVGEIDPQTKLYVQPTDPAQSHTEVYFPNWGWLALDSAPDLPLLNLTPRQLAQLKDLAFSEHPLQSTAPNQAASPTPSPANSPIQGTQSPTPTPQTTPNPFTPSPNPATPISSPSPPPPADLVTLPLANRSKWVVDRVILQIMVASIALCGVIVWYLWDRHRGQQQLAKLPPVEQIYRSMVANLSKQGLVKRPAQTQLEYADSASQIYPPKIAKVVWEISHLYTAWRYGKQQIDVKQLTKKLQYLQQLQELAAKKQHK